MTKSDGTTLSSGNEVSQSLPVSPDKANLFELWKRSEFLKFQDHLGQLEAEGTIHLKEELQRIKKVERKLKLKLTELENKERDLANHEAELKRGHEETATRLRRQAEEHQSSTKLLQDQHTAALRIEKEKLKSEESRRRALELEIAAMGRSSKTVSGKKPTKPNLIEGSRKDHELQERIRILETDLKIKNTALEQAQQREALLIKSRDHFRQAVLRMTTSSFSGNEQSVVIRLQQTRAELVSSGLYCEDSDVIRQLDLKILKAVKNACGN